MLDLQLIRNEKATVEGKLKTKDASLALDPVVKVDITLRNVQQQVELKRAERRKLSQKVGEAKARQLETGDLLTQVHKCKQEISCLEEELNLLKRKRHQLLSYLPNIPHGSTPVGVSAQENVCFDSWGTKPEFSFTPKHHVECNEALHLFEWEQGARLSGSGWPVYLDRGSQLEWALLQFMIHKQRKKGFQQRMVPHLILEERMWESGQLPKFKDQLYACEQRYLIPTAETALNGLHANSVMERLPQIYFSYTPCYRREAGAHGKNERGLIRIHQFNKVEMFAFAQEEQSVSVFQTLLDTAQEILQDLKLHYRCVELVTGDLPFASARTVDLEVWLPGQGSYSECSSISDCSDFQARRSKTRYRAPDGLRLVHTLNGSGLATPRVLVALIEHYQQEDGSMKIPEVLQPWMGGQTHLSPIET